MMILRPSEVQEGSHDSRLGSPTCTIFRGPKHWDNPFRAEGAEVAPLERPARGLLARKKNAPRRRAAWLRRRFRAMLVVCFQPSGVKNRCTGTAIRVKFGLGEGCGHMILPFFARRGRPRPLTKSDSAPNALPKNDIEISVFPHLTDRDLKELGVSLGRLMPSRCPFMAVASA
jgi:hypothetical protein